MKFDKLTGILFLFLLPGCTDLPNFEAMSETDDQSLNLVIEPPENDSRIVLKKQPESESGFTDIFEKNLFSSERTFIEPADTDETSLELPPTPARSAVDVPSLELIGTLITSDKTDYAFIKNASEKDPNLRNRVVKYEIGQWIGDYMLSTIEANKVTLIRGEDIAVLKLKVSDNVQAKRSRGGSAQRSSNSPPSRAQQTIPDREREMERKKEEEMAQKGVFSSRSRSSRSASDFTSDSSEQNEKEGAVRGSVCGASTTGRMRNPCGR